MKIILSILLYTSVVLAQTEVHGTSGSVTSSSLSPTPTLGCTGCTVGGSWPAWTVTVSGSGSFNPSPVRVTSFGDSITNNTGTTNNAGNGWAQVVGSNLTGELTDNEGIGGTSTCNGSYQEIWENSALPSNSVPILYTYMFGTNDANNFGGGAYEATATLCRNAALEWIAIPASSKTYGQNCTIVSNMTNASGTIGGTFYPTGVAIYSTATGAQFSCSITTTSATPVYLWFRQQDSDSGSFTWTLNGGSTNTQSFQFTTASQYSPCCVSSVRIPTTGAGTQTIAVTVNSTNNEFFYGIGTVPPAAYGNPRVIVNGVPKQRTQSTDTAQNTAAYNTDVQNSVTLLAGDGLNIQFSNIRSLLCTQYISGVCANAQGVADMNDTLHPNDQGHGEIATVALSTIGLPANQVPDTLPWLTATTGSLAFGTSTYTGGTVKVNSSTQAGTIVSGTTGAIAFTLQPITIGTPTNLQIPFTGYNCSFIDQTTPSDTVKQTAATNTTVTASGTVVSGDVITYTCKGY